MSDNTEKKTALSALNVLFSEKKEKSQVKNTESANPYYKGLDDVVRNGPLKSSLIVSYWYIILI